MISASIQSQKNAPAMCSIQIPANDYAMDLKSRTLVHLFAFDVYNGVPAPTQVSVAGSGIRRASNARRTTDFNNIDGQDPELVGLFPPERWESTPEQDITDLENENYKLIFGGEIMGIQFSKTPTSRSVVLQCMDWSSYWDIALQYMTGQQGGLLGGGGLRAAFTGTSTTVFSSFLQGSGDIVANMLATAPRSWPNMKGTLLGGVMHIIEAIGGVYFGEKAIRGINDFFSLAEMRLHITQMVGANPYSGRDESRLLNANGFGTLFSRSLSGLGKLVSVRQVLLALQRYIFHEIVPITAPRYIPPLYDPTLPRYETLGLTEDPETAPLARVAAQMKARAEEIIERQNGSVDAASAIRNSNRRGGLRIELARLAKVCDEAAGRARRVGLQGGQYTRLGDFFGIQEVSEAFAVSGSKFNDILGSTTSGRPARSIDEMSASELRAGGLRSRGTASSGESHTFQFSGTRGSESVVSLCTSISSLMQRVLDSRHRRRIQRTSSQPYPPPRLLTQIYRPDAWMVAPPRCNVFFPELYSQFQYGRDFQKEVTRLMLRTHNAFYGSDILFDGCYIAPRAVDGVRTGRSLERGRTGRSPEDVDSAPWVSKELMDHELFTGIIPVFERMADLNLHALRGGHFEVNGVRVGYAQLAANHIFFQYRFKSRDLQLSGKFNPYAVLGFPCLVVDKYLSRNRLTEGTYDVAVAARLAEAIRDGEGETGAVPESERNLIREANGARVAEATIGILEQQPNTHYLGTPGMIVHTLDCNSGGNTQVQMEYARTTNEKAEYMGDNVGARVRRRRNVRTTHRVGALEAQAPSPGSRGPRGGQVLSVVDVTDSFTRRQPRLRATNRTATGLVRYRGGKRLPLYVQDRQFTGRSRTGTQVLIGVEQPASSYGAEVVALVGAGGAFDASTQEILVVFRAYEIVEEIGAYGREEVELPPEDYTFPPWYGNTYRTQSIGGLYAYYFGTGAITDPLTVLEPGAPMPVNPPAYDPEVASRALSLEFAQRMADIIGDAVQTIIGSPNQSPTPGFTSVPELSGGELIGPRGDTDIAAAVSDTGTVNQIRPRAPIAEATEELVRIYSRVKTQQFDVHQFLKAYTWRPIASMVDLFGTANLEITNEGEVVRGVEGFHSRAFGDFDDLRQLVGPTEGNRPRKILGLDVEDVDEFDSTPSRSATVAARMDTRKEKRLQVLRYLYGVMAARGIVG